jgi:hypothetical protein
VWKIFVSKKDEVTRIWRRLQNEEVYNLYCSPNIVRVIKSRRMSWTGHVAPIGGRSGAYRVLVGRSEGKRPLGRPRRSWEKNIENGSSRSGIWVWTGTIRDLRPPGIFAACSDNSLPTFRDYLSVPYF